MENEIQKDVAGQMRFWEEPRAEVHAEYTHKGKRIPQGLILSSMKRWREEMDELVGDDFLDLFCIAEQLIGDLEFHQSNSALLESAMERQDKEIMFLRKRLSNLTEQKVHKEGSD